MTQVAQWIRDNTPAAMAVGGILTAWGGYFSGNVSAHDAIGGTFAAFGALVIAYAHVDAAAAKPAVVVATAPAAAAVGEP